MIGINFDDYDVYISCNNNDDKIINQWDLIMRKLSNIDYIIEIINDQ